MSKAWASGSTRKWRKVRAAVLERDGHRCRIKLADYCTSVATEVHHTVSREAAGDDPTHLVAACRTCNVKVGEPGRHDPAPRVNAWWEDQES
jgi:5-methylcytosine-specific restriction endonuclease McrA